MTLPAQVLIGFIAALHFFILWLEMFAWESRGKIAFKGAMPDHMFRATKKLAANQGLYNGFLAAGLVWSLLIIDAQWQIHVATFFLLCVAIAGIFGAVTVSKKIILVQTLPALIALSLLQWPVA